MFAAALLAVGRIHSADAQKRPAETWLVVAQYRLVVLERLVDIPVREHKLDSAHVHNHDGSRDVHHGGRREIIRAYISP